MILCSDPREQYLAYKRLIDKAVIKTFDSGKYILGDNVELFENEFSNYLGTKFGVGVANGTDAIEIALRALEIGPNDEVITVSHTANATVSAIECVGAKPVLVDIDDKYFGIDESKIENSITKKTKAIIAVHLYGQSLKIDHIKKICKKHSLFLIEDVAQAHGATFKQKRLGSFGDISTFSFYPTKNLGAIGDGGFIATSNENLFNRCKNIREYGWKNRNSILKGRNSRLDEIQAAILLVKLKNLDQDNEKRKKIAIIYNDLESQDIITPRIRPHSDHVYHLYVCKAVNRDKLIEFLNSRNIFPGIHYPLAVHMQNAYQDKIKLQNPLNITEEICKQIISLPMYPQLSLTKAKFVRNSILDFYKK